MEKEYICGACNGSGEGYTPGYGCGVCGGSGAVVVFEEIKEQDGEE